MNDCHAFMSTCQSKIQSNKFMYNPVCLYSRNSEIDDSEICIQGYTIIRLDCSRHGGGFLFHFVFVQR